MEAYSRSRWFGDWRYARYLLNPAFIMRDLNPAVTVAMVLSKRMKADKLLLTYWPSLLGAFLAGAVLYGLLAPTISAYELAHGIVRVRRPRSIQLVCSGEFPSESGDSMAVVSSFGDGCRGVRHVLAGDVYLRLDGKL